MKSHDQASHINAPDYCQHKPTFMNVSELATYLRVTKATIYDWVHHRRIPFRKHGSRLVFYLPDILKWSDATAVEAKNVLTQTCALPDYSEEHTGTTRKRSLKKRQPI